MKKLLAILGLTMASQVFAGSATIEGQTIKNVNGSANQANYSLTVREDIIKGRLVGDVGLSQTTTDGANNLNSSRLEAGLIPQADLGFARPYVRVAVGQKFTTTADYSYYSVEPGVNVPVAATGLTARVAYRFRTAFENPNLANDTTRTWRAGVFYAVTKLDTIGVRYDRINGDADQKVWAVNYTRGF